MDSKVDTILNPNLVVAHNELEGMFRDGVEEFRHSIDKMALSLYSIQKHGTWRTAKSHEGESFPTWSAYTEWLGDDAGLSRSSMFDYKSMVRFAIANNLVDSSDQFIDRGGVLTFRRIKEETICNYNGEIIGLKGANSDNPAEVIKDVVEIIDPDARPMDQVKLIKEVIGGATDVVEVFFRLRKSNEGGYNLIWMKESNVGHEEGLVQYKCPDEIFSELKSKFHILD